MEAERDLAEDAHWKRIQQNTFTRWVNEHLKVVQYHITNLETDLSDGLRLIALIEVLSQKRIPKFNKRPTFRSQKLENVSVALQFLEKEKIKIVNIDSSDIVDCKLKLILGLIWTLILHYSISMPVWDGEEDDQGSGVGLTPKQRLLNWINTKVPNLRVNNFTADWTSGKAVGALVDGCAPGLCPDWEMWNQKDALENASEAMGLADDWLDVRQLIKPEEIVNPNIDEQSMMTYLSQYPNAKLKEGAPLRPKSNITSVKVYGPGVESEGITVAVPTTFIVETFSASKGNLEVKVLNPSGYSEKANVVFNNDKNASYTVSYTPKVEGLHRIYVKFFGKDVPGSPYEVKVGSLSKVTVSGPGIQNEVSLNKPTYFDISAKDAGRFVPEVFIVDTVTSKKIDHLQWKLKTKEIGENVWRCEYVPKLTSIGLHNITVMYGNSPIKGSPFPVKVVQNSDARKIRATGRGLQPRGIRIGDDANFKIYTEGAGEGELEVNIMGPGGITETATIQKIDATTSEVHYFPIKEGRYVILITYDGQEIPKCPFEIMVAPKKESSIIAHGPGLTSGVVGYPAAFVVETNGETGALGFTIAGPSQAEIECHDNGDGSALVKYHPTAPGEYAVHILCDDEDIPKSPFIAYVQQSVNFKPENVKVYGPVLQKKKTVVNEPSAFSVDTSQSGVAKLDVKIQDIQANEVPVTINESIDGTKTCTFIPITEVPHTIQVNYGGVAVQNSPFRIYVDPREAEVDVSKIKIIGLESSVIQKVSTDFAIDLSALGEVDVNKLTCSIIDPAGNLVSSKVFREPHTGILKINYTPSEIGQHNIEILYDNVPVNGTPFIVNVQSGCDPTKCKAYGPGLVKGVTNNESKFTVETKEAGTGGLSLAIEGPSEAKMTCIDNRDGSCDVEYLPTEPGEYDITIRFSGKHIPGSPFRVLVEDAVDPSKVQVYGPAIEYGNVKEGTPTYFDIDVSNAGSGKVAVEITSLDGKPLESINVEDRGEGIYRVHFLPPKLEASVLNAEVTFAGQVVPCSPFVITVLPKVEEKEVEIVGYKEMKAFPASLPAEFQIQQRTTDKHELNVIIQNPKGKYIKSKIEKKKNGVYSIIFTPDEFGDYSIHIKRDGKEIDGSPFIFTIVPVGDATKCKLVEKIPEVQLCGKKNKFHINTRDAGEGAVTCRIVSEHGSEIDVDVDKKDGQYEVSYILKEPAVYKMDLKYGGQPIPNGSFDFKATDQVEEIARISQTTRSYTETTKKALETHITEQHQIEEQYTLQKKSEITYRTVTLEKVPLPSTGGKVIAEVKMPSGNVDKPIIEDNRDGTVSVKYDPKEEGIHELAVKYNGEHVQGSPYKFHVDSIASGYVTAYGSGLTHGVCGEPCNFTISTKGAGAGGLSLAVEGPSKADISYQDNKDGTVSVTYLPTAPGEYKISVRFGDKNINGSPFFAKITGEGRKRNQISVGSCSEVTLPGAITDADLRSLNASIQAPSGLEEPCFLKRMPTGNIGISFTPREIGEHNVSVKRVGKHIQNSPFKVNVCEREVGDAKKVKVTGASLKEGHTHIENHFSVDTRNAGYGGLSLSIEGPSKAEIVCSDKDDGTLDISYKPTEPGYYIVNLKFADHHVDGSPFTVKVTGEGSNRQREKIQRQREPVPVTEVGSQCKLTFKMPGITSFDLAACVTSPGDVSEDAEIQEVEDGLYAVHFVPKELGVHTVSVRYKDMHIPGSPFQFTVGPLRDFGAHLVKAGGSGLERGEVAVAAEFNVWTREAGGGSLAISVEGPSKAEIEFKDRKDGSCDVSYNVSEPGEYRIGLKFNDRHIPDSPYKVYISPGMGDAHKLEVQQFPQGAVQADTPAQFMVRKNGAKGELDAKVVAPSNTEDDCFIQLIDPDMYSVRFYPRENGIHAIHVKFNQVHIPGSPFKIKVGKDVADPACVHATGSGLEEVKTGHKSDFIINTCNAGAGSLAVTMDGPSKVSMDCTEVEEGYKVRFTPLLPGDYYASIKYNNMHIVGSPFKILCRGEKLADEGAQETSSVIVETVPKVAKLGKNAGVVLPHFKSDGTKVQSKGMGLKKAYLGKQNQFTVCATDAGNNILYVGMYGPKGPCDEVFIKHTGRNNYTVNYLVRDRGEYVLLIKWGDEHIPGSPYKIDV